MVRFNRLIIILICLFIIKSAIAADIYWIDVSGGAANWAACESDTDPGSGNRCTMAQANSNISAGETVYMISGTYTTSIDPANSGSSGNPIIYEVDSGDSVTISGGTYSIDLSDSQNYITIQLGSGTSFILNAPSLRWIHGIGNSNIIIDGISITGYDGDMYYYGNRINNGTNWTVKNCTFINDDAVTDISQDTFHVLNSEQIDIGPGNIFGLATHNSLNIDTGSRYIRIHNNTFQNYWRHGLSLLRDIYVEGDHNEPEYILVENNVFDQEAKDTTSNPLSESQGRVATSIALGTNRSIFRENTFDRVESSFEIHNAGDEKEENWLYHNTIYQPKEYTVDSFSGIGIWSNVYDSVQNNFVLNNIFYDAEGTYDCRFLNQGGTLSGNSVQNNIFIDSGGNANFSWWGTSYYSVSTIDSGESQWNNNIQDNPDFVDAGNQDFTLQSVSPAINAGTWLATVVSKSGNVVTIGTDEAYAFAPSDWSIPNFSGDTIYDDDGDSYVVVSQTAHNQITLDDATNIQNGDTLTIVNYSGAAPDIGRFEYTGFPLSDLSPTSQQECQNNPQTVNLSFSSGTVNCYCREDTNPAHDTYSTKTNQIDNGEGGTSHNENFSQACGGSTTHYISCNTASDGSGDESEQAEITIDVAAESGPPQPPPAGMYFNSSTTKVVEMKQNGVNILLVP